MKKNILMDLGDGGCNVFKIETNCNVTNQNTKMTEGGGNEVT